MLSDEDGQPQVGSQRSQLGVRVDGPQPDISLNELGNVEPHTGGMSVSPTLECLPFFLQPRRLRDRFPKRFPGARGKDPAAHCWRMGEGPFLDSAVNADLRLRPDSADHGLVEPARTVPLAAYQDALAATRDQWIIDEGGGA